MMHKLALAMVLVGILALQVASKPAERQPPFDNLKFNLVRRSGYASFDEWLQGQGSASTPKPVPPTTAGSSSEAATQPLKLGIGFDVQKFLDEYGNRADLIAKYQRLEESTETYLFEHIRRIQEDTVRVPVFKEGEKTPRKIQFYALKKYRKYYYVFKDPLKAPIAVRYSSRNKKISTAQDLDQDLIRRLQEIAQDNSLSRDEHFWRHWVHQVHNLIKT